MRTDRDRPVCGRARPPPPPPSSETSATRPSRVMTVTIGYDINGTTCDTDACANAADTAATALGVVVSEYTFKFYLIPHEVLSLYPRHTRHRQSPGRAPAGGRLHLFQPCARSFFLGVLATPSLQAGGASCSGWSGVAYVGPTVCTSQSRIPLYCRSWHRYNEPSRAWVHELGHNIGASPVLLCGCRLLLGPCPQGQ